MFTRFVKWTERVNHVPIPPHAWKAGDSLAHMLKEKRLCVEKGTRVMPSLSTPVRDTRYVGEHVPGLPRWVKQMTPFSQAFPTINNFFTQLSPLFMYYSRQEEILLTPHWRASRDIESTLAGPR